MKKTLFFFTLLTTLSGYAKPVSPAYFIREAKEIIKSDDTQEIKPDYKKAIRILEEAIKLYPTYAEAYYYLGYAYSRESIFDATHLEKGNVEHTKKVSTQFEKVIQLSPKYTGELFLSDPYSKITGEWGSLAFAYLANNKPDSAKWALLEGKRRGGFSSMNIEYGRNVLKDLPQNAILISSGDLNTFPLLYLQVLENYRPDVWCIDATLLNTVWYPKMLEQGYKISFEINQVELDSLFYKPWTSQKVSIERRDSNVFSWTVNPSYYDSYILQSDILILNLLKKNAFEREVYYTAMCPNEIKLSLNDHLQNLVFTERINYDLRTNPNLDYFLNTVEQVRVLSDKVNPNSTDDQRILDALCITLLVIVWEFINNQQFEEAEILFNEIENKVILNTPSSYNKDILKSRAIFHDLFKNKNKDSI